MNRIPLRLSLLIVTCAIFIPNLFADHEVWLTEPNTIPSYCQEDGVWCGAASGQMILQGFPEGKKFKFQQKEVWETIQKNKGDDKANWATDPDGLQITLTKLGLGDEANWKITTHKDAKSLMYSIAHAMTEQRFPTAVLVWGFAHWVVIDGVKTDVNPLQSSEVTLQEIEITNPWPPCTEKEHAGVRSRITGDAWYKEYWHEPGNLGGSKWDGNFLAVLESPTRFGHASPVVAPVPKNRNLSVSEIMEGAKKALKDLAVDKASDFAAFRTATLMDPMLVHRKTGDYYLTPLRLKGQKEASGALILDAATGRFEEIGIYPSPIHFLNEKESTRAVKTSGINFGEAKERSLVFEPSDETKSRLYPVWKLQGASNASVYVTQQGRTTRALHTARMGN